MPNFQTAKYAFTCSKCKKYIDKGYHHQRTCSECKHVPFTNLYNILCLFCKKQFSTTIKHKKFCSITCRKNKHNEILGRTVYGDNIIPSGSVGAIAELRVAAKLLEMGYSVFRAISQSCYCDLIAIKENKKLEIEVRTAYKALSGKLAFSPVLRGTANIFGLYERNSGEIVFLNKNRKVTKI